MKISNEYEKKLTQKQLGELCEPKISEPTTKYELNILNPKIETLDNMGTGFVATSSNTQMGASNQQQGTAIIYTNSHTITLKGRYTL